jgi:hypothetical protein
MLRPPSIPRPVRALILLVAVLGDGPTTQAGGPFHRHPRHRPVVVAPTARVVRTNPTGMLGTFYPDPMLSIAGNGFYSGGYSPLGMYGTSTLSLDGPVSPFRSTSAPVLTYTRGYDGLTRPDVRTSFSFPNRGDLAPVVYPTRANYYYGFRQWSTPPEWDRALNWIDQD